MNGLSVSIYFKFGLMSNCVLFMFVIAFMAVECVLATSNTDSEGPFWLCVCLS